MERTFDTSPSARLLTALANIPWKPHGAISEIVDNALGDQRGNADEVLIIWDKRARKLTVRDNGVGMKRIGHLFQLGSIPMGWSATDIGQFGSGGTMALLWLATDVRIYTMRNGKVMFDHVRWKDHVDSGVFPQVSDEWKEPTANTPTALRELGHGTQIELWIRRDRAIKEDQIQRELAHTYAPALRQGKIIRWLTVSSKGRDYISALKADPFPLPSDKSKIVRFRVSVASDSGRLLQARGEVALYDDLPWKESFVSVGFGHRNLMTTRDCYQSADGETQYGGTGVRGWVDLISTINADWKPKLTVTKDDIDDANLRAQLMHQVFIRIEPLLKQTERDRLAVILGGLSLELTDAFNNLNDPDFEFDEDGTHGAAGPGILRDDRVTFDDVVRPFKPITPKVVDPSRRGPYPGGNAKPPAARLDLLPVSDKEIDGALCRMQVLNEHESMLKIEINKDHDVVEELLKPRQTNRIGLNMMVTREVASGFIKHPQLMQRLLSRRLRSKLDEQQDDTSRERYLARLLMDSARRPKVADEAVA